MDQDQLPSLERDLLACDWLRQKVIDDDRYAQNLYAAMCNQEFQKQDVWPVLADQIWGCSWRYAGGIISDMRGQGDYLDWYCSGMGDGLGNGDKDGAKGYVSEGTVTEEIRQDLDRIGWIVVNTDYAS